MAGERYSDGRDRGIDLFGGENVIVWGGIYHNGQTDLKIVD